MEWGFKKTLNLSLKLATTNFKLRNEGTYLGTFWYLLNPILLFGLLYFVFSNRIGGGIENYGLYLLTGIIGFNFFNQITSSSTKIILNNGGLIKSIKFPSESFVLSNVLLYTFSHFFELIVLGIFVLVFTGNIFGIFLYLPLFLFFIIFCLGVSFFLATVSVYIIDISNVWVVFTRLLWFATPIFYSVEKGSFLYIANLFNPVYYFITVFREAVIYSNFPSLLLINGIFFFSLLFFIIGFYVFERYKGRFAEYV